MFDGHIFKLHGDMDHGDRKTNFFGFDKQEASLLICTDVASRGLDFKHVNWIIQWDLSSQVKEYVNRVGRTARIAQSGQSLCFVMPSEKEYVQYMEKNYKIQMREKNRFNLMRVLEKKLQDNMAKTENPKNYAFRTLKAIDDPDEKQECLHCIRQMITSIMMNEQKGLKEKARVAKNSSSRAYAGHSAELRHIFNISNLNLTEYSRAFGIYKIVHNSMPKFSTDASKSKSVLGKRSRDGD